MEPSSRMAIGCKGFFSSRWIKLDKMKKQQKIVQIVPQMHPVWHRRMESMMSTRARLSNVWQPLTWTGISASSIPGPRSSTWRSLVSKNSGVDEWLLPLSEGQAEMI